MLTTYSVSEIKHLLRSLDAPEIRVLSNLVNEEISGYTLYESRAIFKMISLRQKALIGNEVMFEYLLAYN